MKKDMNSGLRKSEIRNKVMQMHPGDVVEIIPDNGKTEIAVLEKIYPNIVQFRKKNGLVVTLDYFSAMKVNVIKPSGFEERSEDMAMNDIINAFSDIS